MIHAAKPAVNVVWQYGLCAVHFALQGESAQFLTLDVHAQRELQSCVCVCVCVCPTGLICGLALVDV